MPNIELRIAPPFLGLIAAAMMCGLAYLAFVPLPLPFAGKLAITVVLLLFSSAVFAASKRLFTRLGTTWKPQKPEKATALITTGIYRHSRNPMYLAASALLLALGIALGDLIALLLVPCFVLYLTRFQIVPEERALERLFGEDYREYKRRVRRWL